MSGVDPMRRREIRRRVTVMRDFLSGEHRTAVDKAAAAGSLGLSADQFSRLVRSWRTHGQARLLAGAAADTRRGRRRTGGIADEVRTTVASVVADLGSDARNKAVRDAVVERCVGLGLRPPSNGTIWNMLMEARRREEPPGTRPDGPGAVDELIVGRLWFDLPVDVGSGLIVRPEALTAVSSIGRRIAAIDLACGPQTSPLLDQLLDRLDRLAGPQGGRRIVVTSFELDAIDGEPAGFRHGLEIDEDAQGRLARLIGRGIGRLDVHYRMPRKPAIRHLAARHDSPLTPTEAEETIAAAIRDHNVGRRS